MDDIQELQRLTSPAPRPQSLAFAGSHLWMGSRETRCIYQIQPGKWTVEWETAAPGTPWGMTFVQGELRVLCGETEEDHRIIRRCVPGQGFDPEFALLCPGDTGSQLGFDGEHLHLSQWYAQRVVRLNAHGEIGKIIPVPHQICGQVIVDGFIYLVTTDDEETNDYWLTRVDARGETPLSVDLARIPFAARALAFDGERFWTNHREQHEIVAFARPEAG